MAKSAYDRINALLEEIAMKKEAASTTKADACQHVGKHQVGQFARDDDQYLAQFGSPNQPKYSDRPSGPPNLGIPSTAGINASYTGDAPEDENPSRTIEQITLPIEKYKNSKHAAAVPTDELLYDATMLGNAILYELLQQDGAAKTAAAPEQTQQEAQAQPPAPQPAGNTNAPVDPLQKLASVEQISDMAGGILYGLQKQAEHHAALVGNYMYGKLGELLSKAAAAKEQAMEDEAQDEKDEEEAGTAPLPPAPQEDDSEDSESESTAKKKDVGSEEKDSDEESEEEPPAKDSETEDAAGGLDEQQALEALSAMSGGGGAAQDDILNNLAMSLLEMGTDTGELAGAGPAGAKLASAVEAFRRSGKFHFTEAKTMREKTARAYMKNYVADLLARSRGRR